MTVLIITAPQGCYNLPSAFYKHYFYSLQRSREISMIIPISRVEKCKVGEVR